MAWKQLALGGYLGQLEQRGDDDGLRRTRAEMQRIDGELRGGGGRRVLGTAAGRAVTTSSVKNKPVRAKTVLRWSASDGPTQV